MKIVPVTCVLLVAMLPAACTTRSTPSLRDAGMRVVQFACENGETFEVRFFTGEQRAIMVRGGRELELHQQAVASGFFYTNGATGIRGKGDELMLEIGRRAPILCQAQ